jgi:hypothetical protein
VDNVPEKVRRCAFGLDAASVHRFRKLQDAGNAVYRYSARFGQAVSETGSLIFGRRD